MDDSKSRPIVFISSTVVDLFDLRSSLKFWLEEMGVQVLLSEVNDFAREPDQGTLDSCRNALEHSDFCILLVGWRKGYEISAGLSVTRWEYREALSRAQQGLLRMVILTRLEVSNAVRFYQSTGKVPDQSNEQYRDVPFISDFLNEIESEQISLPGEDLTGSRWIYKFHDFRNIVDALRINLGLFGSIPRKTLLANLEWELLENTSVLCWKSGDSPATGFRLLDRLRREKALSLANRSEFVLMDAQDISDLLAFWTVGAPVDSALRTTALRQCIESREFLAYDQMSREVMRSAELDSMYALAKEIDSYGSIYRFVQSRLTSILAPIDDAKRVGGAAAISTLDLGFLFGLYDRLKNIMILTQQLLDFIQYQPSPLRPVVLIPSSPFGESDQEEVNNSCGHSQLA